MPDATDLGDKIFDVSQAAKRLGIHLSTLRRFIRDGTLWPTRMQNGELGLRESEIQRFIDRFEMPAHKGGVKVSKLQPCFQTVFSVQACAKCGGRPTVVHIPTRQVGYYCEKCCPVCTGTKKLQEGGVA